MLLGTPRSQFRSWWSIRTALFRPFTSREKSGLELEDAVVGCGLGRKEVRGGPRWWETVCQSCAGWGIRGGPGRRCAGTGAG